MGFAQRREGTARPLPSTWEARYSSRPVTERTKMRRRQTWPWVGLIALNLLFVAPGVALEVSERPAALLAPSGDLLLLVGAALLSFH